MTVEASIPEEPGARRCAAARRALCGACWVTAPLYRDGGLPAQFFGMRAPFRYRLDKNTKLVYLLSRYVERRHYCENASAEMGQ